MWAVFTEVGWSQGRGRDRRLLDKHRLCVSVRLEPALSTKMLFQVKPSIFS
uniref:Uncharacterized protein n=1 Tax=Anguilla anguilla TaxID=7936 RepID=A0A0E9T4Z2_ANGAN